jgi:hypothetical protein
MQKQLDVIVEGLMSSRAIVREIQRSGIQSLRDIARALAARGIPTARGGAWTPVQVSDILLRGGGSSGRRC